MQKAYINTLYELAKMDNKVISVLSDSGTEYDEMFARDLPNQYVNFGIAEQNMVAAAAGMANCGKIPFVYTTGAFLAFRALEFIRNDVCLQNNNVVIVGMGSGLAWSTLGPTHHTLEDISILRSIPGLVILSPASPREVEKVVKAAYYMKRPVYIRLGMKGEKEIYDCDYNFEEGKNVLVRDGHDVSIFVTGSIISEVIEAAKILDNKGISAEIINVHTIKPFDKENLLEAASKSRYIFTVEEHNIMGGLGSIIAEILAECNKSVHFRRIGINDCFAKGYGSLQQLRIKNGLDFVNISNIIETYVKNGCSEW